MRQNRNGEYAILGRGENAEALLQYVGQERNAEENPDGDRCTRVPIPSWPRENACQAQQYECPHVEDTADIVKLLQVLRERLVRLHLVRRIQTKTCNGNNARQRQDEVESLDGR